MAAILLVEDEAAIAEPLAYVLNREGWQVEWVTTGQAALHRVSQQAFDAIVLDVGLPDMDGFEVCRRIRQQHRTPLLFLTARNEEVERIIGLELGADDYCAKPFSPRELVSRIRAIWRRTEAHASPEVEKAALQKTEEQIVEGPFRLDLIRFQAFYYEELLSLTRYEWRLLHTLLCSPERVFSRSQLMQAAWDHPDHSQERTVDSHIKTLRHKLRAIEPEFDPILTHRGVGYSLILP